MFEQVVAIIRNTFFESIRQPIMLVVLVIATIAIILSNPLSAFTMEDDQRMLIDLGMATIFVAAAVLASFVATSVLTREIENKTALTVISKPVGRPVFVLGKFLGVAAALVVASLYMTFLFLLVENHGVLQTVRDPVHLPVITFGVSAGVIGLAVGIWCNYFYNMVFASTVICVTTPLVALAYILSLKFNHDFSMQPMGVDLEGNLWMAILGSYIAILMLTAIAIAASTRFGQVMTLSITLGVFVTGLLSDYYIGSRIQGIEQVWLERASARGLTEQVEETLRVELTSGEVEETVREVEQATVPLAELAVGSERLQHGLWTAAYSVVPNFQTLLLTDALTQRHRIPPNYIIQTMVYGLLCIAAALALATILFQRREVG